LLFVIPILVVDAVRNHEYSLEHLRGASGDSENYGVTSAG